MNNYIPQLDDIVTHPLIYNNNEEMKVVGIRKDEIELEGDWSGGTHNVCEKDWCKFPFNEYTLCKRKSVSQFSTETINDFIELLEEKNKEINNVKEENEEFKNLFNEEINVRILKVKKLYERKYCFMAQIYINGQWYKEMGPFHDPQLALQQISQNEDLKEFMRPDLNAVKTN